MHRSSESLCFPSHSPRRIQEIIGSLRSSLHDAESAESAALIGKHRYERTLNSCCPESSLETTEMLVGGAGCVGARPDWTEPQSRAGVSSLGARKLALSWNPSTAGRPCNELSPAQGTKKKTMTERLEVRGHLEARCSGVSFQKASDDVVSSSPDSHGSPCSADVFFRHSQRRCQWIAQHANQPSSILSSARRVLEFSGLDFNSFPARSR
ncbi:hypothetical protein B0T14DRAFT_151816 [Immersiella caudata]|uniref:Uncharacterized protein n=1 Tax=Immersiella caudata TaxID=314043 RepID=A0AA40C2L6_9PEZI|nr:hypothetical protein B0T14DRAFT_151816 [Immersiella caudata]